MVQTVCDFVLITYVLFFKCLKLLVVYKRVVECESWPQDSVKQLEKHFENYIRFLSRNQVNCDTYSCTSIEQCPKAYSNGHPRSMGA